MGNTEELIIAENYKKEIIVENPVKESPVKSPPVFFPKKEPDTESIASKKSTASKKNLGKKTMPKFDIDLGLKKDKKPKKPSSFKKFIAMCAPGTTKKTENIEPENIDPQKNPPSSLNSPNLDPEPSSPTKKM